MGDFELIFVLISFINFLIITNNTIKNINIDNKQAASDKSLKILFYISYLFINFYILDKYEINKINYNKNIILYLVYLFFNIMLLYQPLIRNLNKNNLDLLVNDMLDEDCKNYSSSAYEYLSKNFLHFYFNLLIILDYYYYLLVQQKMTAVSQIILLELFLEN